MPIACKRVGWLVFQIRLSLSHISVVACFSLFFCVFFCHFSASYSYYLFHSRGDATCGLFTPRGRGTPLTWPNVGFVSTSRKPTQSEVQHTPEPLQWHRAVVLVVFRDSAEQFNKTVWKIDNAHFRLVIANLRARTFFVLS